MASKYPKYLLQSAIAEKGNITIPPNTSQEAGTGRLSQQGGWGIENAIPIEQGGVPPNREDFNGVLFLLSQLLIWYQNGGIMKYSATLDYEVGNEVLQNGTKYRCVKENGISSKLVTPGSNRTYWKNIDITVPAGAIMPFHNVTLGGSDGRRPIFWGTTQADEGWVLCDGGSDGRGGLTPNLIDRFIKGSTVENSGSIGGSDKINVSNMTINGTVGATALTVAQLPAHSHTAWTEQAGNHAHTKGSMNITGEFGGLEAYDSVVATGCFYKSRKGFIGTGDSDSDNWLIGMNAAESWSGETSYNGLHNHAVGVNATGSGQTHTHSFSGNTSIENFEFLPPFYSKAFFVQLPE